jgi:hypothetical protein
VVPIVALAVAAAVPEPPIAPLLEGVRLSVPDARDVRDLQVCPPKRVSRDGRRFVTEISLARPHTPREYYTAQWVDGRVKELSLYPLTAKDAASGGDILNQIAMRAMERSFEHCRWVSAAELEAGWAFLDAKH